MLRTREGDSAHPRAQHARSKGLVAAPHEIAARHAVDATRLSNNTHLPYRFQSTGPQPSSPSSAFAREKTLLPVNGVAVFVLLRGLG